MNVAEYISQFKKKMGRLPSQMELTRKTGLPPQSAIQALVAEARKSHHREENDVQPYGEKQLEHMRGPKAVSYGLFFVAALTSGLSIYFTGLWFMSMFNIFIAGAISVSMVAYMVLSPQAVQYVKGIVKIPLWVSFMIALVFSMGSTVAGQYNKLTENVDIVKVNNRALLDSLKQEESELLSSIEVDREQQAFHQKTLESLSTTAQDRKDNAGYIYTERNMVNELSSLINDKTDKLSKIREQIRSELEAGTTGATEERKDFYSWLSQVFGVDKNSLEFWVAVLPAVFIDIIAALSLNIAIGMRRG